MQTISTVEILAIRLLDRIRRRYGFNLQGCYISWAISEINCGSHAEAVYVLAGMSEFDNPFEVEAYFVKALEALKISIPDETEAIKNYVGLICEKTLKNTLSEKEACEILSDIYLELNDDSEYFVWYELNEEYYQGRISEEYFNDAVKKQADKFLAGLK